MYIAGFSAFQDPPAIPNHAYTLALGLPVESCSLFQVFLATDSLRIAKAGLSQCITIAPS
jgi:hypothetical protein